MQSPQKLRERLQTQQKDIESASQDLQNVLADIGNELNSKTTPRLHPQTSAPSLGSGTPTKAQSMTLEARIAALEKQCKATLDALSTRATTISADVTTSLQVSEARVKQLDQLYRDANTENEILYARFNEEIEKATSSVRRGKGGEEVDRRLRAAEEEAARLRKENARLKREVAGLKAQIRE
jgi:chromosome segregation ATPase